MASRQSKGLSLRETAVFGMLGGLMYASKLIMEMLPNVHLIGVFIVAITVVYRKKALYPLYTFVFLTGLFGGFSLWWIPYLYIWLPLWAGTMLLPKDMPKAAAPIVYSLICSAHGFLYGILYAPSQALIFGLNFESTLAWIAAGLPFDLIHGISNFICGLLIVPVIKALRIAKG